MSGKRLWTVDQIKKYLMQQDSMGDMVYNLSDENIEKANKGKYECFDIVLGNDYMPGDIIDEDIYDVLDLGSQLCFSKI
jgi:hypothetical protein